MEKLLLCSKTLYDIDMVDKVNKIEQMNKDLNGPAPILFNTYGEFQIKKKLFLYESKKKFENWAERVDKGRFKNIDFIIRGLKTCNYNHSWHKMTITPQFDTIKIDLLHLLHEFYDFDWTNHTDKWLGNIMDSVFIGIIGALHVFTQLGIEFENIINDIIYTSFEKQIYLQLFLRDDLFHLKCNSCGETDQISVDNICFKCNFITPLNI